MVRLGNRTRPAGVTFHEAGATSPELALPADTNSVRSAQPAARAGTRDVLLALLAVGGLAILSVGLHAAVGAVIRALG